MDHTRFVGVDVGKAAHHAVALGQDGDRLFGREVANRQADVDELVAWAGANQACVVVDQPGGGAALLIQACWDGEVPVGYLHGLAMARARDFYEGEAKTDPKDAYVLADVARAHPARIVWLDPVPEERARLELLIGYDDDLRGDVNRTTNRLRSLLSTHWPALEGALHQRVPFRSTAQLLAAHPSPEALRRGGKARLVRFLKARGVHRAESLAERLLGAASEQRTVVAGADTAAQLVSRVAGELDRLLATREEVEQEIRKAFFALPEARILVSLPGVGPRLGARMLVE